MRRATDHLARTDHAQRLDLGCAGSGGRTEAADCRGAITAD